MDKKCPVCGSHCEDIDLDFIKVVEIDADDLADFVFDELVSKGYAPKMKEINTILTLVDEYMVKGVLDIEED
jgi:formate dehydrogenase maturation protein FdhE